MSRPPLTEHAQALVNAIRDAGRGEWVNRRAISQQTGRKTLNAGDIALLEMLTVQGYIETKEVETKAPSGYTFVYRVKEA